MIRYGEFGKPIYTLDVPVAEQIAQQRYTERLLKSMRGRIILGTALHLAIKELEKVEGVHRQISTLQDMRSILESDYVINIHDDDEEYSASDES
tara:strand:- start:68 stop:349 length:282 start_codon:yes stop_codon:yes gene_type:complete